MDKRTAKVEARGQESCRAPRSKFGVAEDWGRYSPCRPPPCAAAGAGAGAGAGRCSLLPARAMLSSAPPCPTARLPREGRGPSRAGQQPGGR